MILTLTLVATLNIAGIYNVADCETFDIIGGSAFKIDKRSQHYNMKLYFLNSAKRSLKSEATTDNTNSLLFKNSHIEIEANFESGGRVIFDEFKAAGKKVESDKFCYLKKKL